VAFTSIKVSGKGGGVDFKPVPAGVHLAIVSKLIGLGVQKKTWQGQEKNREEVYIGFELPEELVTYEKAGKQVTGPSSIGRTFTANIGEKSNLGPFLESARGRPFTDAERDSYELTSIVGKIFQIGVVHEVKNGKTYANISVALPLSTAQLAQLKADPSKAKLSVDPVVYSPGENHDEAMWVRVPQWLQKRIGERVTDSAAADNLDQSPAKQPEEFNDEIPF
jgi:hypothetical protein